MAALGPGPEACCRAPGPRVPLPGRGPVGGATADLMHPRRETRPPRGRPLSARGRRAVACRGAGGPQGRRQRSEKPAPASHQAAPPRGWTFSARGRRASAQRAAGGTRQKRLDWFGPAAGGGARQRFTTRPGRHRHARRLAHHDRPSGSHRRPRSRPPACCAAPAHRAGAAPPIDDPGPRPQGRRPPRIGRDAGQQRQDWFGPAAGTGAGQRLGTYIPPAGSNFIVQPAI